MIVDEVCKFEYRSCVKRIQGCPGRIFGCAHAHYLNKSLRPLSADLQRESRQGAPILRDQTGDPWLRHHTKAGWISKVVLGCLMQTTRERCGNPNLFTALGELRFLAPSLGELCVIPQHSRNLDVVPLLADKEKPCSKILTHSQI
jgi:hypothetical protein